MNPLDKFTVPFDRPYDLEAQRARAHEMVRLYSVIDSSPSLASYAAARVKRSFWDWITLAAWTFDEKESAFPKKPFAPYRYIKTLADYTSMRDRLGLFVHSKIAFVKSRQMMITWLAVERILQQCVCNPCTGVLIGSKTMKHGMEILRRIKSSYAQLPPWVKLQYGLPNNPDVVFGTERADFPNESYIVVLPEKGGDAIRSYSGTMILLDEAAFQPDFDSSWTAATGGTNTKPGHTAIWAVSTASTANTMLFKNLVMDDKEGVQGGVDYYDVNEPGISIHRNKLWRIDVVRLHYTADPSSAAPGWKQRVSEGMDEAKWRQEMEMDFYALSGQKLFPMWDASVHLLPSHPRVEVCEAEAPRIIYGDRYARATLGLGVDHGLRNPCGGVLVGEEETRDLWALWDYAVAGRAAPDNARAILQGLDSYGGHDLYNHIPFQAIDAMHSMADRSRLKIEDLYRYEWVPSEDGTMLQGEPLLWRMKTCAKGKGSVEAGISKIAELLLATLAAIRPDHPYWAAHNYDRPRIEDWAKRPRLWISPACTSFANEIDLGRYKDLHDPNLNQPEGEVDAHNHVRKAFSYVLQGGLCYLGG